MRLARYRFRPSLWPTLATVLVLPCLIALGFWQLDRAEQKRVYLAALSAGAQAAPLRMAGEPPAYAAVAHRRAVLVGHYDSSHQFFLENQVREGRAGYLVLTPFVLADGTSAVLVDRGWLPAEFGTARPDASVSDSPAEIAGVLDHGPSVGMRMGPPAAAEQWPRQLSYLDFDYLNGALPYRVAPYLLRLDADQPAGFRRDWHPPPEMGPERHLGYAVQWFGLALALVVIYLVVNLKRMESEHDRS